MKRKQILSILMASAMLVGMVGCGGGSDSGDSSDSASTTTDDNSEAADDSSDSSSGEKTKITICWRDDGTDIELNANYQQMMAAYEQWDKRIRLN